jgi:hypothetical protein
MIDYENVWENMLYAHDLYRFPHHVAMLGALRLAEDDVLTADEVAVVRFYCSRNLEICKLVLDTLSK